MNEERQRRIGENEVVFRSVNEQIEKLNHDLVGPPEPLEIVCECGSTDCVARIAVPLGRYEEVRSDPTTFLALPGHDVADVEDVVADHGSYVVLRKKPGLPSEVARETDPRSPGG